MHYANRNSPQHLEAGTHSYVTSIYKKLKGNSWFVAIRRFVIPVSVDLGSQGS